MPVKQEYQGEISGVVHGTSASGSTLFIEPITVLETNNEIRVLENREREEISRILAELSALAGEFADSLNAANEVLVDSFLNRKVKFTDIPNGIEYILNIIDRQEIRNIEDVLNFDKEIREKTYAFLEELYGNAQYTTSI